MSVLRGGASYASQGRISVAGHRAEPNEHGRSMCRGRYSACSGYNCRWWAAVALGGPVSINQPTLNTRPRARTRAESHDSPADSQLPRMRFARTIYVSRRIAEGPRGASSLARARRQNIAFSGSPRNESSVLRVRRFCKTRTLRARARGQYLAANWREPFTPFAPAKHRFSVTVITTVSPLRFVRCFVKHAHNKHDLCAETSCRGIHPRHCRIYWICRLENLKILLSI